MQERARVLCGLATLTVNTTITPAIMLDFVRTSLVELGGIVKEYTDEQLLSASGTVPTVANVATVALPTNFSDLVRLSWVKSATEDVPLEWASVDEFAATPPSSWTGYGPIKYRLMGPATLELFPTPTAVYTLKLHYTTGIYIATAADTVTMRDAWDQWVVFNVCMLIRMAQQKTGEDLSPASFVAQRDTVEMRIRKQLKRDKFGPQHVRDSRSEMFASVDPFTRRGRWY